MCFYDTSYPTFVDCTPIKGGDIFRFGGYFHSRCDASWRGDIRATLSVPRLSRIALILLCIPDNLLGNNTPETLMIMPCLLRTYWG